MIKNHKINLRLEEEDYLYLLSKGGNMSDYVRLLIKVDRELFTKKATVVDKKKTS